MSATPSLKPVQPDRQTREQIAQMTIRCVRRASARLKERLALCRKVNYFSPHQESTQ